MAQCPDLVELKQNFGICFSTMNRSDYCVISELDHLKNGTVMSLPGGQLHAGPAYTGFCAVLFWTAHGKSKDVYDINVQYFDGVLLADLLLPLWSFISLEDRYYFLKYLYTVTQRHRKLSTHFAHDNVHFQMFLDKLTDSKKTADPIGKTIITTNIAPIPLYCPIRNEQLECISVPNLVRYNKLEVTDSSGRDLENFPIAIYQRVNGSVT
jgi:hypothetical protein